MSKHWTYRISLFVALCTLGGLANGVNGAFPWQESQARVLPEGGLEWKPEPFVFEAGESVRYIDFEAGDDQRDRATRQSAWKHHPWDPASTGAAMAQAGWRHTYVFKRGVIYRGVLRPGDDVRGTTEQPIRLTSDPTWGDGEAAIYASSTVTNWRRGGGTGTRIPDPQKVYVTEVDFLPRTLWAIDTKGQITRLKLARTPNWNESDPNDVMSEWPTWENPEWWKGDGHEMTVNDRKLHAGIDRKNLVGTAEDFVGATVWSEWGIVMGSPYPSRVEGYDPEQHAVAFRGPWTWEKLEKIIRGNRYYLEDKPQWLDEPGEF